MPIDVLIIGQGLAGSLLAWELIQREMRVVVLDNGCPNASQVAAGLINPVTGQRLVKSSDIDELLPVAMQCYRQLSEAFRQRFFVALPMLRILKNVRERRAAEQRLSQQDYQAFLSVCSAEVGALQVPHGVLLQAQTGYLKTGLLLSQLRKFLMANASYRQNQVDYNDIVLHPRLSWQDLLPRHIVFCEGYQALHNPWFGGLPFQPAKGEILTCSSTVQCPEQIINFGHWLIPIDAQRFKLGATYQPGQTDTQPTELARQTLLDGVSAVMPDLKPIEVTTQQAGVRPATLDKQPLIGSHPQYANLHIFNGFGSKGSLAIPRYAQQFAAALQQRGLISAPINVQRYYETHFAR